MMPPRNPEITWTIPVDVANYVLMAIGKRPLEEAGAVDRLLREQAAPQLQQLQAMQTQQSAATQSEGEILPPQRRKNGPGEDART